MSDRWCKCEINNKSFYRSQRALSIVTASPTTVGKPAISNKVERAVTSRMLPPCHGAKRAHASQFSRFLSVAIS